MTKIIEYKILKKIYLLMIIMVVTAPITLFFTGPLLLLYIFLPNLYIYLKYYKKNEYSIFQSHIRKVLKKYLIAMAILLTAFLPTLISIISSMIIKIPLTDKAFLLFAAISQLMILITMVSIVICVVTAWIYYLNQIINASNEIYNLINKETQYE